MSELTPDERERDLLFKLADEAANLYDALFAKQDLWSDRQYREIQVAAVRVDQAIGDLAREHFYVRPEDRGD